MEKVKVEIVLEAENIEEVLSNITSALEYEGIEYSDIRVAEELKEILELEVGTNES